MPKATRPKSRPSATSKPATSSSTNRRLALADFIDSFGDVMPLACQYCRQNNLVCRVHVRSGKCNHCHRHNNSDCNIRISEEEWSSMKQEKIRLQERLAAVQQQRSLLDQEERELRRAFIRYRSTCCRSHRCRREKHPPTRAAGTGGWCRWYDS